MQSFGFGVDTISKESIQKSAEAKQDILDYFGEVVFDYSEWLEMSPEQKKTYEESITQPIISGFEEGKVIFDKYLEYCGKFEKTSLSKRYFRSSSPTTKAKPAIEIDEVVF
jgi:hypothetical protein